MALNALTIIEASEKLGKREISSRDLTRVCLDRIIELNEKLNACLTVCEQEALEQAEAADKRRAEGGHGALLGIPVIVKDNIMTAGIRTTAASKILEDYIAPYDATVVEKLRSAGAVILAKANLDEFAHGASTENSAFGPTRNPWDTERVPGGSSGGSAAAVAADMCLFALGTDTGGSIRCPASFCGITGLKPTYGRASRFGLIAMTSSTDVPGPLAKSAMDAAIVMRAVSGHDKRDATAPDVPVDDYPALMGRGLQGLRIGLPVEYFEKGTDEAVLTSVRLAADELKALGAQVKEVSLPHTKYGIPVYYIITPSEVSSNLSRFDGIKYGYSELNGAGGKDADLQDIYMKSRGHGFGPEAKRRIMLGTYALSAGYYDAYYLKAQKVRTIIKREMDEVLGDVDVLLTPTAPHTAFRIGEQSDDPLKMYLEDIFVTGASLAGLPAISVPCGFSQGLPIGLQLIGRRFGETAILQIAHQYQLATDWHKKKPGVING